MGDELLKNMSFGELWESIVHRFIQQFVYKYKIISYGFFLQLPKIVPQKFD